MNNQFSSLNIRTYQNDGGVRTFCLYEPEIITRTLRDLNVSMLFARENVLMADGDLVVTLRAKELARIDFVTDRVSVWDHPFVLGAPVELTEAEFRESIEQPMSTVDRVADLPAFLEITMTGGQRYFFWMEVVGGQTSLRAGRVRAMLSMGFLVIGLRHGGIGILNLSNMASYSVYPEPVESLTDESTEGDTSFSSVRDPQQNARQSRTEERNDCAVLPCAQPSC